MPKYSFIVYFLFLILIACNQSVDSVQPSNIDTVNPNSANQNNISQSPNTSEVNENNQSASPDVEGSNHSSETDDTQQQKNDFHRELVYSGSVSDQQSGITQYYTLRIKSDFSAASIGGGPYTIIEDQGDGSYMWLDGTIIGMSFRPSRNSCSLFSSDGSYFCTLYRD